VKVAGDWALSPTGDRRAIRLRMAYTFEESDHESIQKKMSAENLSENLSDALLWKSYITSIRHLRHVPLLRWLESVLRTQVNHQWCVSQHHLEISHNLWTTALRQLDWPAQCPLRLSVPPRVSHVSPHKSRVFLLSTGQALVSQFLCLPSVAKPDSMPCKCSDV
jgi:hypothetical protein